jgi:hypothetical protein
VVALVYFVVFLLVVAWISRLVSDDAAFFVAVLGRLLFAMEANDIRRRSLAARGFEETGASFGRNISEAEARFFSARPEALDPLDRRAAMLRAAYSPEPPPTSDEPILGLFPEADR